MSNFVILAINPSGGVCTTDVFPQFTSIFVNGGGAFGIAGILRATTRQDVGTRAAVDVTADYHVYFGYSPKPGPFPFNPMVAFPPSGTCTVYTLQGDLLNGDDLPGSLPNVPPLDFGPPLVLSGPNGMRTLTATFFGANAGYLGGAITNNILPSTLYLDPGSYTVTGVGGKDIGPFSTTFTIPQPVTWTNRNQLIYVDRTKPLAIAWTGGDSGQVVAIVGFGEDLPTNSSAVFGCIAPPGAGSFTVPPDILSNLPSARANPLQSKDVIYLVTLPGASVQNLNAKGLDDGSSGFSLVNGKTVVLQ